MVIRHQYKVGNVPTFICHIRQVIRSYADAIRRNVIGFDAVKQLLVARIERRAPRLDLSAYPYLPQATVMTTAASDYTALLTAGAA